MTLGELPQDAAQIKLGVVSTMNLTAEPLRLITPTTIKNCFVKCDFLTLHTSSSNQKVYLHQKQCYCIVQQNKQLILQTESSKIKETKD
jgi:hypothetical protein